METEAKSKKVPLPLAPLNTTIANYTRAYSDLPIIATASTTISQAIFSPLNLNVDFPQPPHRSSAVLSPESVQMAGVGQSFLNLTPSAISVEMEKRAEEEEDEEEEMESPTMGSIPMVFMSGGVIIPLRESVLTIATTQSNDDALSHLTPEDRIKPASSPSSAGEPIIVDLGRPLLLSEPRPGLSPPQTPSSTSSSPARGPNTPSSINTTPDVPLIKITPTQLPNDVTTRGRGGTHHKASPHQVAHQQRTAVLTKPAIPSKASFTLGTTDACDTFEDDRPMTPTRAGSKALKILGAEAMMKGGAVNNKGNKEKASRKTNG